MTIACARDRVLGVRHRARGARCGLTLVETLAVVVILAMATGIGVVGLSGMSSEARLRSAANEWQFLDGAARLASQMNASFGRGLGIATTPVDAHAAWHGTGSVVPDPGPWLVLPPSIRQTVRQDGRAIDFIPIDRRGCSPDYQVEIGAEMRRLVLSFDGLTGAMMAGEVNP